MKKLITLFSILLFLVLISYNMNANNDPYSFGESAKFMSDNSNNQEQNPAYTQESLNSYTQSNLIPNNQAKIQNVNSVESQDPYNLAESMKLMSDNSNNQEHNPAYTQESLNTYSEPDYIPKNKIKEIKEQKQKEIQTNIAQEMKLMSSNKDLRTNGDNTETSGNYELAKQLKFMSNN